MRFFARITLTAVACAAVSAVGLPAHAVVPGTAGAVAFARDGNIHVRAEDGTTSQVTRDGLSSWPWWSPKDPSQLAYVHAGDLWLANIYENGEVSRWQITHGRHASGPAWSPDARWLAFLDGGRLYRVRVGFDQDAAGVEALARDAGPSNLRESRSVAWSPDGNLIAYPGTGCDGIHDDCLTVLNLTTNGESTLGVHGGGGVLPGYSTTPAFTADGSRVLWTTQRETGDGQTWAPLQINSANPTGGDYRLVGDDGDALPAPSPAGDALLVVAKRDGANWIVLVRADGTREALVRGTQPDWQVL
ncbi:TolB family protein [Longispora urticae]